MKKLILVLICIAMSLGLVVSAMAQEVVPVARVLITNANIFDGQSETLAEGMDVLIEGNKIVMIDKGIMVTPEGVTMIDATGKTLMPGLIDAHWHTMYATTPQAVILQSDIGYINIVAVKGAESTLMRGFTTVRDIGGNCFAIKKATDEGIIKGPRIYPSGAPISQTSGHFDFRGNNDVPANSTDPLTYIERNSIVMVADGVPEVIKRVREQLRMGATQIKLAAGGGVMSSFDPLDVSQYTFEELKAAVDVAKTWNTYVAVHVFTDAGAQTALKAGVMSIEHGNLMTDETFELMKEKGAWFSMQPILNDEEAIPIPEGSPNQAKFIEVTDGTSKGIELAKKYGVKTAFGTDILFAPALGKKQGKMLAKLKRWYTPYETLKIATSTNAELVKMSGPRDPYPGALGVIEEGALADMILVDGNPLENIDLVADPENNFVMIMKDGKIYKNTVR
jgi:imidazolonepropionase-like amidohydrolase